MVRQWQEFMHGNRESESYLDALPDFVMLAESYGHVGVRVEKPSEVEAALQKAFALRDRCVFLDVLTDRAENVYPMMLAGSGHHEMLLSEAARERELA